MGLVLSRCPSWIGGWGEKGDIGVLSRCTSCIGGHTGVVPGPGGSGGQPIKQSSWEFVEFLVRYLFCQNLLTSGATLALQGAKDVMLERPF